VYKAFLKPIIGFILSRAGILILSPIFIIVTTIFYLDYKGNPLFLQTRPEKHGKLFTLIKFKTMNDKKSCSGQFVA
jgi:lipopolysaccharide/colanic/teichoic acid biosynthesis glycosyltransferase